MSAPSGGLRRALDPRVLFGIAVTVLALGFAFRGVSFPALAADLKRANLSTLVLPSAACYLASLWIRVLRWRHLAAGLSELPLGAGYRATAIRFMVNNVFPLRLGELVGPWVIAREVGGSTAGWFGTIVLERVFDSAAVASLAVFLIGRRIDLGLLPWLAVLPIAGIVALRAWPGPLVRFAHRCLDAALPAALATRGRGFVDQLAAGLSGLTSASGFAWVLWHTVVLWGVVATLPFLLALRSLGIDLGGAAENYFVALTLMAGVGVAVALPQAPGFFGMYHAACRELLVPLGVSKEHALALGTLAHAVFWVSIIVFGLFALPRGGTPLRAALRAGAPPEADRSP